MFTPRPPHDESNQSRPRMAPSPFTRHRNRKEAITYAIQTKDIKQLSHILEEGELPEDLGYEMVRVAARANCFDAVRLLTEYGCPVVRPRVTEILLPLAPPLHYAVKNKNGQLVRFLLSKGCTPIKENAIEHYRERSPKQSQ